MDRLFLTGNKYLEILLSLIVLVSLYFISVQNYLLFHSMVELFSIVIAYNIFIIALNSHKLIKNGYLLLIGISYFFIGFIDLLHTLSYKGMGVFSGYGANLPTQLWIIARYMESITLILAVYFIDRKVAFKKYFFIYLAITALLVISVFNWHNFPDCYIEGKGLTLFKKVSEYIISIILLTTIYLLNKNKNKFDVYIFKLVLFSIIITIFAELSFTFYVSVYGISNFTGHIFKLISFYLIYKALVESGFKEPVRLLFRDLKTKNEELEKALAEIKELKGIIPICSHCKRVRDDDGYWKQVEEYVSAHTDADFSHGMCPDCLKKLYPDVADEVLAKIEKNKK